MNPVITAAAKVQASIDGAAVFGPAILICFGLVLIVLSLVPSQGEYRGPHPKP